MANGKVSKMHKRVNSTPEERLLQDVDNVKVPVNTFWDEAEALYATCIVGLDKTHGLLASHIQSIMADPEQRIKIKDVAGLTANINLLSNDIQKNIECLDEIHALHAGRTGGTVTPDDHMLVLQINGRYAEVIEMYNTVTMPTVAHIFEQTNITDDLIASQIMNVLEAEQRNMLDPSVTSDVAFVEVK